MKTPRVLTAASFLIVFAGTGALADLSADLEGVKAASKAFYEAVVVVDDGTAMEKIWAHKPYVTYLGPKSTSIIVGWDAREDVLVGIQQSVCAPECGASRQPYPCGRGPRMGNRY